MKEAKKITVVCSTFGNRLGGAEIVFRRVKVLAPSVAFIIIHQVPKSFQLQDKILEIQKRLKKKMGENFIQTATKGVAVSRNIAIDVCKSRYLAITDDDVFYLDTAFVGLLDMLDAHPDVVCHTFNSLKPTGENRALFPKDKAVLNNRQILRVATFEMVFNCDNLKRLGVRVREDMGVGADTQITMGEEALIVSDIKQAGGVILHHDKALVVHPEMSTGVIVSPENVYSKGVIIRRCFKGFVRFTFFVRDVNKIMRDRENKYGKLDRRIFFIWRLFEGCYLSGL